MSKIEIVNKNNTLFQKSLDTIKNEGITVLLKRIINRIEFYIKH